MQTGLNILKLKNNRVFCLDSLKNEYICVKICNRLYLYTI